MAPDSPSPSEFASLPELPLEKQERTSDEFTLFPELPLEMRQKIWRATLPGPRVVRVSIDLDLTGFRSSTPFPVALHVSQESRAEAKMFYKLSFGARQFASSDGENSEASTKAPRGKIYFNFDIDTFFVFRHPKSNSNTSENQEGVATGSGIPRQVSVRRQLGDMDPFVNLIALVMTREQIDQIRKLALCLETLKLCIHLHSQQPAGSVFHLFQHFRRDCVGRVYTLSSPEMFASNEEHKVQVIDIADLEAYAKEEKADSSDVQVGEHIGGHTNVEGSPSEGDQQANSHDADWTEALGEMKETLELAQRASGFTWEFAVLGDLKPT